MDLIFGLFGAPLSVVCWPIAYGGSDYFHYALIRGIGPVR